MEKKGFPRPERHKVDYRMAARWCRDSLMKIDPTRIPRVSRLIGELRAEAAEVKRALEDVEEGRRHLDDKGAEQE